MLYGVEALEGPHAADLHVGLDAGMTFLALAWHCAPAILLSFVLVGVLTALSPDGSPGITGRGLRVVDAAAGAVAGLPHPLCSCRVAPLYTNLVDAGASPASARAFLVAAPELGVPAVLLSARLLGLPFTVARVVGAAALAVVVGVSAAGRRTSSSSSPSSSLHAPTIDRLRAGMRHGLVDAVDHLAPWILLGLTVAALLEPALADDAFAALPGPVVVAALAIAALPLYLCAAGTTPVAALLVHKGASIGAALALLLVGPATSMPTLALVRRMHGARAAAAFAVLVVGGAVAAGLVVDLGSGAAAHAIAERVVDLHAMAAEGPSVVELCCLVVLGGMVLASLVRQGVRGFLVQIMSPQHAHPGDHDHGPGCGHDHGPPVAPALPRVALSFDPRGGAP